jgi:hypothetical protein
MIALPLILVATQMPTVRAEGHEQRWEYITQDNDGNSTLLDLSSIVRTRQIVTIWTKTVWRFVATDKVTHSMHRYGYSCGDRTYQLLTVSHFNQAGNTVRRPPPQSLAGRLRDMLPGPVQQVVPESVAERVFLRVCAS